MQTWRPCCVCPSGFLAVLGLIGASHSEQPNIGKVEEKYFVAQHLEGVKNLLCSVVYLFAPTVFVD